MRAGFTILELLIVVAILGILSAVAVPLYIGYIDTAQGSVAQNSLRSIYLQQQEYLNDNNSYYASAGSCGDYTSTINTNLFGGKTVLDSSSGFTYCITQTSGTDYTAQANEISGSRNFTINQNNVVNF